MTGSAPSRKIPQGFDEVEGVGGIQSRRRSVKEQNARVPEHLDLPHQLAIMLRRRGQRGVA